MFVSALFACKQLSLPPMLQAKSLHQQLEIYFSRVILCSARTHSLFPRSLMYCSPRNVVAAMLHPTQPFKDATTRLTNALPMEAFRTRLVPITKRFPMIVLRLPWPILVLHRVVVPSSLSIFDTTSFSIGSTRVLLLLIPSLERYVNVNDLCV